MIITHTHIFIYYVHVMISCVLNQSDRNNVRRCLFYHVARAGFDYSTKVLVCARRRGTTNFVSGPIVVFARLMFIYILAPAVLLRSASPPDRLPAKYTLRYVPLSSLASTYPSSKKPPPHGPPRWSSTRHISCRPYTYIILYVIIMTLARTNNNNNNIMSALRLSGNRCF